MFELFRKSSENNRKTNREMPIKADAVDFDSCVRMLPGEIESLTLRYEKLRKLPVGDHNGFNEEREELRADKVIALKISILDVQREINRLALIADNQEMSVFTRRRKELEDLRNKTAKILRDTDEIIMPQKWDKAV